MNYIVEIVKALAWPIAAIWLGYVFRGEVRQLLARMSQFKYRDFEAKFDKDLARAEAEAAKVPVSQKAELPGPDTLSKLEQLHRIAEVSPRAAIMEAWVLLETEAKEAGFKEGLQQPTIYYLAMYERLPEVSWPLIQQLRQLRNKAAHLPDFVLTQEEAERYLELAVKTSEIIKIAKTSNHQPSGPAARE